MQTFYLLDPKEKQTPGGVYKKVRFFENKC